MTYYDEQLRQLQAQCSRKKQLQAQMDELRSQYRQLSGQVSQWKSILLCEQEDVEKLEGRSLASFFYYVIGKRDERLTKEREEAYGAKVKYDAATRELAQVEDDLKRGEEELSRLRDCEGRYETVLAEKAKAVKASGGPEAEEIFHLEEQQAALTSHKKELTEAISAGRAALSTVHRVLDSLDSAEGWGTWDMLGGGLLADVAKHGHLDDAQREIEHLQSQLRRFKTELADVTIYAEMQVNVEGFLRFADYFFDGLFVDWAVMDRISSSKAQVQSTRSQIEGVLSRLQGMARETDQKLAQISEQFHQLVVSTQIKS